MELRALLSAQVSAANCALCPISGGYVSFSFRHPVVCCGQMPDISWLRNVGIASIEILAPDPGGDFPTAYEEGRQTGGEGERTQAKSRSRSPMQGRMRTRTEGRALDTNQREAAARPLVRLSRPFPLSLSALSQSPFLLSLCSR